MHLHAKAHALNRDEEGPMNMIGMHNVSRKGRRYNGSTPPTRNPAMNQDELPHLHSSNCMERRGTVDESPCKPSDQRNNNPARPPSSLFSLSYPLFSLKLILNAPLSLVLGPPLSLVLTPLSHPNLLLFLLSHVLYFVASHSLLLLSFHLPLSCSNPLTCSVFVLFLLDLSSQFHSLFLFKILSPFLPRKPPPPFFEISPPARLFVLGLSFLKAKGHMNFF